MAIKTSFKHRFWKNDGTVNAGGKVWTYVAGTTTPVSTYTTSVGDVANTNPIILDSKGEAEIWTSGTIKVNVLESDDTQVTGWPVDNVGSGVTNDDANARWAGTSTGTANAIAIAPSPAITAYAIGQSFIFKAGASPNSAATTIAISGLTPIAVQSNGAACTGGEILANNFYMGVLDTLTTFQISKIGEPTLAELGAAALAGSSSQPFAVSTLTASDTITPHSTKGIVGTTTNDSAQAGSIGEIVRSTVASGSAISLTNATAANVTSISLTAGDWDVVGMIGFIQAATTTVSFLIGGTTSSSATTPNAPYRTVAYTATGSAITPEYAIPVQQVSTAGTTTIYLVANSSFGVSTMSAYGTITARRVR